MIRNKMKGAFLLMMWMLLWGSNLQEAKGQTDSFSYDGAMRDFIVYVPASYNANVSTSLVLNLHGYTSNASQQQFYSAFNQVADTAGIIVVYPNGLSNAWNSGFNIPYNSGVDDVGFLSALIDTMLGRYNINENRVYSTGMSNGGYMSMRLACELDDKIAAVASVTGSMTPGQVNNCTVNRPVPVMQIHGTNDGTVPYNGDTWTLSMDDLIAHWVAKNSCTGTADTTVMPDINTTDNSTATKIHYQNCADGTEVLFFKIDGGEHTWPGAPINLGVTNRDINASGEVWDFFYRHERPNALEVQSVTAPEMAIYPNPAKEHLQVTASTKLQTVELMAMSGKVVKACFPTGSTVQLEVADLAPGVYLLKAQTVEGAVVKKVIIH